MSYSVTSWVPPASRPASVDWLAVAAAVVRDHACAASADRAADLAEREAVFAEMALWSALADLGRVCAVAGEVS